MGAPFRKQPARRQPPEGLETLVWIWTLEGAVRRGLAAETPGERSAAIEALAEARERLDETLAALEAVIGVGDAS
jgi:hypothetical protein